MTDSARGDGTLPAGAGGVAWLEISDDGVGARAPRSWTGPLGLQIVPLVSGSSRYCFSGARLRGVRCVWAASTVSGAELFRAARPTNTAAEPTVHILAALAASGSVFEATSAPARGTLEVIDPHAEVDLRITTNTHLFALNVPASGIGLEPPVVAGMLGREFDLSPFQVQLLRSAVTLLVLGQDELNAPSQLVGVDRYLAGLAGLLLRTAVQVRVGEHEQSETIRARVDAIIREQAADSTLTPASIAAQLNTSLRQLYRAFSGTDSPATRIRRRRLEQAAELLSAGSSRAHVDQVAAQCGFVSAEYFSRAFRREFGASPRAYRSAHKDNRADGHADGRNDNHADGRNENHADGRGEHAVPGDRPAIG